MIAIRREVLPMMLAAFGPLAFCAINVWSRIHDTAMRGAATPSWEIVTWETSSAAITLLLIPLIARMVIAQPILRNRGIARSLFAHASAAICFWILHVGGFILIRSGVYALAGSAYRFGGSAAWLYELPKDLVTYTILATTISVANAFCKRASHTEQTALAPLVIRDGARIHLINVDDIVAVSAAGNYLQVHSLDGRAPLMRNTMASLCATLPGNRFVRTHRSWLINRQHVLQIVGGPTYEVRLVGHIVAPISRRYRSVVNATFAGGSYSL